MIGFLAALLGIILTVLISLSINSTVLKKGLNILGKYNYDIYLMHQRFLISRIIGISFTFTHINVFLISLSTILIGIDIPMAIGKFIIRSLNVLRQFTVRHIFGTFA